MGSPGSGRKFAFAHRAFGHQRVPLGEKGKGTVDAAPLLLRVNSGRLGVPVTFARRRPLRPAHGGFGAARGTAAAAVFLEVVEILRPVVVGDFLTGRYE